MTAAVVIPWMGGCEWRERALAFARPTWWWPTFIGSCTGEWNKAKAVADAVGQLPDEVDVLVVADADVCIDQITVGLAIEQAALGKWVVPHGEVRRLTAEATENLYAGRPISDLDFEDRYRGVAGGGVVVVRRDLYEQVPLDPRFVGWGQQDTSWGFAMLTLLGREVRFDSPLIHLWHPPQERKNRRIGSEHNARLQGRYVAAKTSQRRMRALLAEFA